MERRDAMLKRWASSQSFGSFADESRFLDEACEGRSAKKAKNGLLKVAFLSLAFLALQGCKSAPKMEEKQQAAAEFSQESEKDPRPQLDYHLNADETLRAAEIIASLTSTSRFSPNVVSDQQNAPIFAALAAGDDRREVVAAALSGMYITYSKSDRRKRKVDSDYIAVVRYYLDSADNLVLARALEASRNLLIAPGITEDVLSKVLEIGETKDDGATTYAVIEAIRLLPKSVRNQRVMKFLMDSLGKKDPFVLSAALSTLQRTFGSLSADDASTLEESAYKLMSFRDVGVRGRAIALLGDLEVKDERILRSLRYALKDAHPYVRSSAALALAELNQRGAMEDIVMLINDTSSNEYLLEGWTTLDGSPGKIEHVASPWQTTSDAVMRAVEHLAQKDLDLGRVDVQNPEKSLAANAKRVIAWYKQNQSRFPRTDP